MRERVEKKKAERRRRRASNMMEFHSSSSSTSSHATTTTTHHEINLQDALKWWQDIQFTQLQKELDQQGLEIVENQKESLNSRKQLAEQTKEFKKLADTTKPEAFKHLLKSYQNEIDKLTKRSKFAETSFLSVYKKLAEAPDPAAILQSVIEENDKLPQLEVLRTENERLRSELDQSTKDFVDLKGKTILVSRLKEKIAELESNTDQIVNDKILQKEVAMKEEFDAKLKLYKEREFELELQLNRVKDQLNNLQNAHNTTQASLFAHSVKFDEQVSARLAEVEIMMNDLERANERVNDLQRDKELLQKQVSELRKTVSNSEDLENITAHYENQLLIKEAEISRLVEALSKLKAAPVAKQVTQSSAITELETKLTEKQEEIDALQEKLAEQKDYHEIKKELEIIKHIEFSNGVGSSPAPGDLAVDDNVSLETLLINKNKKLQSELTTLRLEGEELRVQLRDALAREDSTRSIISEQRKLIAKLEDDIVHMNQITMSTSHDLPFTNDVMNGAPAGGGPDSIVTIITSQRNRFRKRITELEEQLKKHQEDITQHKNEINALTQDNVKFYEKIRYLESYPYRNSVNTSSNSNKTTIVNMPSDVKSKYQSMYEEKLNPFQAFHEKERLSRINNLNPAERATLSIGRLLFQNKYSRLFAFFYTVILHIFVMAIIYQMSMEEECLHDRGLMDATNPNNNVMGPSNTMTN